MTKPAKLLRIAMSAAAACSLLPAPAISRSSAPAASRVPPPRPAPAPIAALAVAPIEREHDGLFYLVAEINGAQVRFLVDTGASMVVLTPDDARRIGVAARSTPAAVRMQTASGSAEIRWAKLDSLRVGRREVRNLDAAIVAEGLKVSLLGQNALTQLGSVTIAGNRLHLS